MLHRAHCAPVKPEHAPYKTRNATLNTETAKGKITRGKPVKGKTVKGTKKLPEADAVAPKAKVAKDRVSKAKPVPALMDAEALLATLVQIIDDAKAEDILTLDLMGKTSLADAMVVASGTSDRHVGAIASRILTSLKDLRQPTPRVEGMPVCDWVLIDAGDVIVHLFRPEVRGFYNLEKLWGMGRPLEGEAAEKPAEKPKRVRAIKAESAADQSGAPVRKPAARKPTIKRLPRAPVT